MSFDSGNAVVYAILFLVPGFIMSSVLGMLYRRRSRSASEQTLQYLTFSCVNLGLWSWLIVLMIQGEWVDRHAVFASLLVFIIVFVSPVVLGLLTLLLTQKVVVRRLLSAFGFKVERFIPTAWDYKFQKGEPEWVIVRLKDGSSVYGLWAEMSFAGDDPNERDIFIEAVFRPDSDNPWKPVVDTRGILIKSSEIGTIEFRQINTEDMNNVS